MAYPDKTTLRSYGGAVPPAYITSDIPAYYVANQTITISNSAGWYEIDDTGHETTNPLGTSGPFIVAVNLGQANEEKILCSSINLADSFVTVWNDGVLNGRGYDGTIISTHNHQKTQTKTADFYHVFGAIDFLQFNEGIIAALQGGQGGQGAQGYQGAQGSAGTQGPQGVPGTGTQGPQGDAGTGSQGAQGAQGAQGESGTGGGAQGAQGNDGAQGAQGNDGPQGNDGAQGTQGDFGPQGNDGAQGSTGPGFYYLSDYVLGHGYVPGAVVKGSNDNLYIATGSGALGDPATGAPGWEIYLPKGVQGPQGDSGTGGGSQGPQGNDGAQGAQGVQGDQGPQGNDGSQGYQGNDGSQGFQGDFGPQGNDGSQGPQGNDGAQGFQGNDGPQGNDGAQGAQGTVGASFPTYLAVINSPDGIATDGSFVEQTATFTITGGPDAYVSPNRVTLIVSGGSCSYTGYISDVIPGVGTTTFQVYLDGYTGTNSGDQINWYMSLSGIQGVQGNDGSQGAQGNDGNQGAQGNDGAQGAQGYQGQADKYATYSAAYTNIPTIFPFTDDISVSGGLAYSAGQGIVIAIDGADYAVAVVNTYDAVTGILNFTIAASTDVHGNPFQGFSWGYAVNLDGAVGAQGTQGYQGDQGPQGNDGSQGSQGNDGAQGSQGNDGSQGAQGNDGSQGPQGTDALWNFSGPYNPGLIYTTGDVVTYEGQTWYRLIYGASGRTPGDNIWWTLVAAEGSQGAQGLTGDPGIYESADGVPPVNEDILWLDETVAGYAGPQGPQGVQGVQGARGYQGSVGAQGTQGLQGSTGSQGSQGNAGTQGPQGASGTNGSQGPQGSQGNQGNSFSTDDSGWIAVSSFTNSFVVGAAVAYRKLNGIVYLRGSVQSGTPANAAFTLPTGYRPSETSVFAIQQYGLTTNNYITINTDGTVVPQTASAWLNNVVYPIG
jgi:hypothetical protein